MQCTRPILIYRAHHPTTPLPPSSHTLSVYSLTFSAASSNRNNRRSSRPSRMGMYFARSEKRVAACREEGGGGGGGGSGALGGERAQKLPERMQQQDPSSPPPGTCSHKCGSPRTCSVGPRVGAQPIDSSSSLGPGVPSSSSLVTGMPSVSSCTHTQEGWPDGEGHQFTGRAPPSHIAAWHPIPVATPPSPAHLAAAWPEHRIVPLVTILLGSGALQDRGGREDVKGANRGGGSPWTK